MGYFLQVTGLPSVPMMLVPLDARDDQEAYEKGSIVALALKGCASYHRFHLWQADASYPEVQWMSNSTLVGELRTTHRVELRYHDRPTETHNVG